MHENGAEEDQRQRSDLLPLVIFYFLAFAISWLGFVPTLASALGSTYFRSVWWQGSLLLPGIGPAVAAGVASARFASSAHGGAAPLPGLKRSFLRPVPYRWWAVTVLLGIGIMLAASLLSPSPDSMHSGPRASVGSVFLFSILSVAANPLEEIGWRGFAQARLQRAYGALTAAAIVGIFWAAWHIPLFFVSSGPMAMSHTSFWAWAAGVIPQAILLAWLYNRTGSSLAIASVFHIAGNMAGDLFHSSTATVSMVRFAAALTVLLLAGPDLGQRPPGDGSSLS